MGVSNFSSISIGSSSKINSVVVGGYVSDELVLQYKEKNGGKVAKASFHLLNPKMVGDKQYTNKFYVVVYGKKAKECVEHLSVGSECVVIGTVNTWTNSNGAGAQIDATDVFF